MIGGNRDLETICAVSTPPGVGGISVIRVSGPESKHIVRQLAEFLPCKPESHRAYYGTLRSSSTKDSIDEVILTYFAEGKSYTGQETIEISCHGSPSICQQIISELLSAGAKTANRGEFTYRSFMNGKLDLVQAESVLSLIESQTSESSKQALRQLKGELSSILNNIEQEIIWCLANIEAAIDFSTEGIEIVSKEVLLNKLEPIQKNLQKIVSSYSSGRILKEGIRTVLFGRPNVGKSSLLNTFLEDDRAIVSNIAGTTRDIVHGEIAFKGIKFIFLDTAGLRETNDLVEKIGVEKSQQAILDSDLHFFVYDSSLGLKAEDIQYVKNINTEKLYILANKADLLSTASVGDLKSGMSELRNFFNSSNKFDEFIKSRVFFVSAIDKRGRDEVLSAVIENLNLFNKENVLVSNARQAESLSLALNKTTESIGLVSGGAGGELVALSLKEALIAIQETLGKQFDDQVMDRVFREFCIGK